MRAAAWLPIESDPRPGSARQAILLSVRQEALKGVFAAGCDKKGWATRWLISDGCSQLACSVRRAITLVNLHLY